MTSGPHFERRVRVLARNPFLTARTLRIHQPHFRQPWCRECSSDISSVLWPCPAHRVASLALDLINSTTARHPSDSFIVADRAALLRADLVQQLVDAGALPDQQWRDAFHAVPRHNLIPAYHQDGTVIEGRSDHERWLRATYSDTTLITQHDAGRVTSSGTQPSLIAAMLHALDIYPGARVLQVGTGAGYTAALLAERLGAAQVTSIDIDPTITDQTRARLHALGYGPTLVTGDARHGYPDLAPYDRIIATYGLERIPNAWIDQTHPGGLIVAPIATGIARLTLTHPGHASGQFIGAGYFLRDRSPASDPPAPTPLAQQPHWPTRHTDLPTQAYYDGDFRFYLDLTTPGLLAGPSSDAHDLTLIAPDGSHAHITPDGHLTQTGLHPLWQDLENTHHAWRQLAEPPRERYGLTITPERQTIWLDDPQGPQQWNLAQ